MENSDFFIGIAQQALYITALATAPILIPALLAGLVLGMIQAATSINEATLSFVPKLIVVAICLALFGGAILMLIRSEEHTSELQSLMRISYAVFCLKKKKTNNQLQRITPNNTEPHKPLTQTLQQTH